MIDGKWDQLRFSNQCNDILNLHLEQAADRLIIENFYTSKSKKKVPAVFKVHHDYSATIIIENVTASQSPEIEVTPDYQLTVRGKDALCLDPIHSNLLCERVLQRCDRAGFAAGVDISLGASGVVRIAATSTSAMLLRVPYRFGPANSYNTRHQSPSNFGHAHKNS
ncbi:MAG: hypothetical protein HOM16_07540 [Woeseia sp.]|nr:hypothetical protein [Woeseia sp.]